MPDRPRKFRPPRSGARSPRPPKPYDAAWAALSQDYLRRHPRCRCGRPATQVDHVRAIRDGGGKFDEDNLQAICAKCHGLKSNYVEKRRMITQVAGTRFPNADGTSRENRIREKVRVGDVVALRPEPENPHDKNAVAVWHDSVQIGYLARGLAAHVKDRCPPQARVAAVQYPVVMIEFDPS